MIRKHISKANEIIKHYEEIENADKVKGKLFNLFSVLNIESKEATHTSIIADLLDPQGSHGQGDVFLRRFVNLLAKQRQISRLWKEAYIPTEKEVQNTHVYTELNVGIHKVKGCDDKASRLDILLSNDNFKIVIENKFDAGQSEKQLERYNKYLKGFPNKLLIYLTKTGKKYISKTLHEGDDYFCITYKDDILDWLNECLIDCKGKPVLELSLRQYIDIIKSETNQNINDDMSKEVQDLILSNGIKGAYEIARNFERAEKFIVADLMKKIIDKLKKLPYNIENIRHHEKPLYSIFFKIKDREFGIEAFNIGKNWSKRGELFVQEIDFERKNDPKNLENKYWVRNTYRRIWDREEKINKIDEYGRYEESRDDIAQEVVRKVVGFLKTHISDSDNI